MCSVTGLPQGKCPPVVEYMWSFGTNIKVCKHWKTSFDKNCFSAWASTLNMGLISKG